MKNPFVDLLKSNLYLSEESIKNLKEIEDIDKHIEFLDSIKTNKE